MKNRKENKASIGDPGRLACSESARYSLFEAKEVGAPVVVRRRGVARPRELLVARSRPERRDAPRRGSESFDRSNGSIAPRLLPWSLDLSRNRTINFSSMHDR